MAKARAEARKARKTSTHESQTSSARRRSRSTTRTRTCAFSCCGSPTHSSSSRGDGRSERGRGNTPHTAVRSSLHAGGWCGEQASTPRPRRGPHVRRVRADTVLWGWVATNQPPRAAIETVLSNKVQWRCRARIPYTIFRPARSESSVPGSARRGASRKKRQTHIGYLRIGREPRISSTSRQRPCVAIAPPHPSPSASGIRRQRLSHCSDSSRLGFGPPGGKVRE